MTTKEAKENIIKNFRANYSNDHQSTHDIEVFLLNAMEQLEGIVAKNYLGDVFLCDECRKMNSDLLEKFNLF